MLNKLTNVVLVLFLVALAVSFACATLVVIVETIRMLY